MDVPEVPRACPIAGPSLSPPRQYRNNPQQRNKNGALIAPRSLTTDNWLLLSHALRP